MTKGELIDGIAVLNERIRALEEEKDAFCLEYALFNAAFKRGDIVRLYYERGGRPRTAAILYPRADENGFIFYAAVVVNKKGEQTKHIFSTHSYSKIEIITPSNTETK